MGLLTEVGLEPTYLESEPGRASVVVRVEGADRTRPGLAIHGHLDVVPANAADWSVDPFAAEERDGCIWGRGAVDMKDMDAMILANLRHLARTGTTPPRDLVFAFFADEEAGGVLGSHWVVDHHPELFEGVGEAISEVGGYSITVPDGATGEPVRAYLLQTAEKGIAWLRLRASGRAGHGSVPNPENAVVRLAAAIARIDAHVWPREYIASVRAAARRAERAHRRRLRRRRRGRRCSATSAARAASSWAPCRTPPTSRCWTAATSTTSSRRAPRRSLDCRFLPGHEDDLMATIAELAGEFVEVEVVHRDIALDAPFGGDLVESMKAALLAEDPGAAVLPYCLSGGTDNKALEPSSASPATGSRRCGCRPTWTSRPCSTGSTSGCRWTPCGSGRGCCSGCSPLLSAGLA